MLLKPEISFGDILTIFSLIFTAIALLGSWKKDRELKQKEYSDKIRRSASTIVAKLQRYQELTIRFFEDIQPLITEADMLLVKEQNVSSVRDFIWLGLVKYRAQASQRIIDEQIEIAYIDLFGFDPKIQTLYSETIRLLKIIDENIYSRTLYDTQIDTFSMLIVEQPYTSAQLGNKLRNTCFTLAEECNSLINSIIGPFGNEMIKIVKEKDSNIIGRKFVLSPLENIYEGKTSSLKEELQKKLEKSLSIKIQENPTNDSVDLNSKDQPISLYKSASSQSGSRNLILIDDNLSATNDSAKQLSEYFLSSSKSKSFAITSRQQSFLNDQRPIYCLRKDNYDTIINQIDNTRYYYRSQGFPKRLQEEIKRKRNRNFPKHTRRRKN